jgi:hypothetical protein
LKVEEVLKNTKAYVWKERFAVVKVESMPEISDFFAVVKDKNEITLIIDERHLNKLPVLESEGGFRLITFDVTLPFGLVGFISTVSRVLAAKEVSILVVSSFSTDHILVKENDLDRTIKALREIGIKTD